MVLECSQSQSRYPHLVTKYMEAPNMKSTKKAPFPNHKRVAISPTKDRSPLVGFSPFPRN